MAVEIYVSSEELKKTLEYVALIGGNMASGKKQDDDLKQMKIIIICLCSAGQELQSS